MAWWKPATSWRRRRSSRSSSACCRRAPRPRRSGRFPSPPPAAGRSAIASVAIYNKQSGLTFNSIGYPGAQASFVNKFNNKLLANDLLRINPQIVILSFGTNEASNDSLDLTNYRNSYERIVDKIKTTLPEATIVVIGPPDFAELPAACRKEKDHAARATCGRTDRTAGERPPPRVLANAPGGRRRG